VGAGALAVRAGEVVEDRPVLGLHARAVLFRRRQHGLSLVAHRLELEVLRNALQVADAGALDGERLLRRLSRSVVADQAVRPFSQRVVGEVRLPPDHRCLVALVRRRCEQRLVHIGL
jgi:hypothetical protein